MTPLNLLKSSLRMKLANNYAELLGYQSLLHLSVFFYLIALSKLRDMSYFLDPRHLSEKT